MHVEADDEVAVARPDAAVEAVRHEAVRVREQRQPYPGSRGRRLEQLGRIVGRVAVGDNEIDRPAIVLRGHVGDEGLDVPGLVQHGCDEGHRPDRSSSRR